MPSPLVRRLGGGDTDPTAIADVLCDSHSKYPGFVAALPDQRRRTRALRPFFEATASDALDHGWVLGGEVDGRLAGVALWLEADARPWSGRRKLRAVPKMSAAFLTAPAGFRRLATIGSASEKALGNVGGWYLEALGVRTEHRCQGVGARLMNAHLAEIDRVGTTAWVETSDRRNLAFYARFGFEVKDAYIPFAGGPTYWVLGRAGGEGG